MRNIKLTIEYDGKDFNGWQKQPNKLNIQGEIEQAIKQITGEEVDLIASGRNDAGVHALGQIDNYKTAATEQLSSKFDTDVASLEEQLTAGTITQEQYQAQYLELQQAYNDGVKEVEEVAADSIVDFDEISKEGQRISQELNKAKTEKEMWENIKNNYNQETQAAAQQ